jgi:hypothetical protein
LVEVAVGAAGAALLSVLAEKLSLKMMAASPGAAPASSTPPVSRVIANRRIISHSSQVVKVAWHKIRKAAFLAEKEIDGELPALPWRGNSPTITIHGN